MIVDSATETALTEEALSRVIELIRQVLAEGGYGQVVVKMHNGRLMEYEKTVKYRPPDITE